MRDLISDGCQEYSEGGVWREGRREEGGPYGPMPRSSHLNGSPRRGHLLMCPAWCDSPLQATWANVHTLWALPTWSTRQGSG